MFNRIFPKPIALIILIVIAAAVQVSAIEIRPKIDFDKPYIPANEEYSINLLVEFDIPKTLIAIRDDRPSLNLGMVIDRSGSMEDRGKMEYAKRAANLVVDQLNPLDRLAVVEYDDQISLLWPSSHVRHPGKIKSRIDRLYPRGSTNLTGGMMRGADQVLEFRYNSGINRVLLLSDGLANSGITDPREIKSIVRDFRRRGITVSALGLGLNYNEDLMQMIAEHGGGNYYFIENPNQMHDIFNRELGTMFATVAKGVKVRFKKSKLIRNIDIYGYLYEENEDEYIVDIGNIYAGDKLSLVMSIDIDPTEEGMANLGDLEFDYTEVESNTRQKYNHRLEVHASVDEKLIKSNENKSISAEAALVKADDFHEKQIKLIEAGRSDEARANIQSLSGELAVLNSSLNDIQLASKIEALEMEADQIQQAEEDSEYRDYYLKSNKARFYQSKKGKRGTYLMQTGDDGYEVERLQKTLKGLGYYSGEINGEYNKETANAIEKYQKDKNLKADGVAGPKTLQKLGLY